jgi:hypothetical protein
MDRKPDKYAAYIVEHPDHLCLLHLPLEDEEKEFCQAHGGIWAERLGEITSSSGSFTGTELRNLTRRCSRPMLLLSEGDMDYYLPFDHADRLIASDLNSVGSFVPRYTSSPPAFLRFGPHPTELVFPGYERDAEERPKLSVPLYIQESVPPLCSVVTDFEYISGLDDELWSEKLGYVQAEVDRNDSLNVRLEDVNESVRSCSRQMLLLSECMPPLYIPRKSLERLVRAYKSGRAATIAHPSWGKRCRD